MSPQDKANITKLAKEFAKYKEEVGKEYISTFKYLKGDLSAWYNSLTTVCFTIGAVALTFGADKAVKDSILYPDYFWLGALLLILDGLLIFWFKKLDIEKEFAGLPTLRQSEADYWKAEKILMEARDGNAGRFQEYENLKEKFTDNYRKQNKHWTFLEWVHNIFKSTMTDITFGLLVFPILLMTSQFTDVAGISLATYKWIFICLLILYLIYCLWSLSKAIKDIKAKQAADRQIEGEILK